ncbi:transforming growth factor beta superfamily signaling ligand [Ciona intestinalis]
MHRKLLAGLCIFVALHFVYAQWDSVGIETKLTVDPVQLRAVKSDKQAHSRLNGFLTENSKNRESSNEYGQFHINNREVYIKEQETEFQKLLRVNQISNIEAATFAGIDDDQPSVIRALLEKPKSAANGCNLPGQNGNVVRSLRNKGRVLYQDGMNLLLQLRYHFGVLPDFEKITSAIIYAALPGGNDQKSKWWEAHKGLEYTFRVYAISQHNWNELNLKLPSALAPNDRFSSNEFSDEIAHILGDKISNRTVTFNSGHTTADSTHPLDVLPILSQWRLDSVRHGTASACRYILMVTKKYQSEWSINSSENWAVSKWESFGPGQPRLLLVSIDSTQCTRAVSETGDNKNDSKSVAGEGSATPEVKKHSSRDTEQAASTRKRKTRMATRSTICQRHSMWVDFEEMGWSDWVIAPRAFQSYRCAGECPFPLSGKLNGTNHAMLMTMMNSVDPSNTPMPCCVPTRLSSVSMLYLDKKDNVVLRLYEDMVVEACGCR